MADNSKKIALLNDLLQKGQITQEMFDTNVKKLMSLNKSLRPEMPAIASSLGSVMDEIRGRGVGMQNIDSTIKSATPGMASLTGKPATLEKLGDIAETIPKPDSTSLQRINTPKSPARFGKTLKALGILGPALGAMAIGDKAMAGDFGGAGLEGADIATDYLPGIGQIKNAIRPTEMGSEPTDPVSMKGSVFEDDYNKMYDEQSRRAKGMEPASIPENIEEPARYEDMQDQISKRFNFLNKMK